MLYRLHRRLPGFLAAVLTIWTANGVPAFAESLLSALGQAYENNTDLNQNRADVRVRDEDAPKAAAGMRPKAGITAGVGPKYGYLNIPFGKGFQGGGLSSMSSNLTFAETYLGKPRGATLQVQQNLFDGGATENAVKQAEYGVYAARAGLQHSEQNLLQNGAAVYMSVLRETAVVTLRKNNLAALEEQLKQVHDHFLVGEATNTDVFQSEAAVAQAKTELFAAQAELKGAIANYRLIFGHEPKSLEPGKPIDNLIPKSLNQAVDMAITDHPAVRAGLHQVNAAEHAVKVAEAALKPTLSINGEVTNQYDAFYGLPGSRAFLAGANAQLNVPLYQGGSEYASVRQAKEALGKARLYADLQRETVRAAVEAAYARLQTARASLSSAIATVKAAEGALINTREEAKVGLRTTLDVLNAQQALLNARVALVTAQRDRVVSSYAAAGAIGRLSAEELNLNVTYYDVTKHFDEVKDSWFSLDSATGK